MAASNFKPSLALVLAHEGGFVNHPKDPGGATNQGVTQAVYDAYRKYNGAKVQSVKLITAVEVADIYNKQYWRLVRGDTLPCGFDYAVFDFGVNSGVSRAVRYMQRLVGVDDDGVIGFKTISAVEAAARANEEALIVQYCANRLAFLQSLKTFPTFGKGWTRRVVGYTAGVQATDSGVVDYAVMMARKDTAYPLPSEIGKLPGEVPVKAEAPLTDESFVEGPPIKTVADLKALMAHNDELAQIISGVA